MKIALVEDNDDLRELLVKDIERSGYCVQSADCAEALDDIARLGALDLLILDLNLPGEDGLSIAQRYKRANPDMHIIMLTARARSQDKVMGYESGADIYLAKPISSEELMAAIASVARRLSRSSEDLPVVLNVRAMTLMGIGSVGLNRHEVIVLKALSQSSTGSLPYYRLMELCDEAADDNAKATLEVRITRLRKKLIDIGVAGSVIRAIRGEGYQLLHPIRVAR